MGYNSPPALNNSLKADCQAMMAVFKKYQPTIATNMINSVVRNAGITPKISAGPLVQLINTVITPQVHKWEGHYGDHPNDSGGPTCRGVILTTFANGFDEIYKSYGTPETKQAADAFNNKWKWKSNGKVTNMEYGKQILYLVNTDEQLASLWVYKFLVSKTARYPLAMMMFDPFLGFFFVECVWGTGSGVYLPKYANFDGLAKKYGWDGQNDSYPKLVEKLASEHKLAEFAAQAFQLRINHILRISMPGSKNNIFRKGWLNRLINKPGSDLMMMVRITELFLLNSKGSFKFSNAEKEYCANLAEQYKKFTIDIPD